MIEELPEHEQQRMIEALLGKDNAKRLDKVGDGRKFRPAPVIVKYEYYEMPRDMISMVGQWKIDRIENGRRELYCTYCCPDVLNGAIEELRAKGFWVREVFFGAQPRLKDKPKPATRRAMLDRLTGFRP